MPVKIISCLHVSLIAYEDRNLLRFLRHLWDSFVCKYFYVCVCVGIISSSHSNSCSY